MTVEQDVDACESSRKYVHLSGPAVDGELAKYMLPGIFVTCSGSVYVTFFLLEESGCSRLVSLPFPLVFGFRRTISAGCLLMDPFFISRCHRFFSTKDDCG